jgi:hypothetical protein
MGSLADYIAISLSILSLAGALYSFTYTRKTFIFSVCTERAKEVKAVWVITPRVNGIDTVKDEHWQLWSNVISEIVASIVIVDKLADRYKIMSCFYDIRDFYVIFWQQIPTDLRNAIEGYEQTCTETNNNYLATFKSQMRTIIKTYDK